MSKRARKPEAEASPRGPAQGPDPVWGIGVFIVGLLTMATAGANTWHWIFNIGEAVLLIGVAWFLITLAINAVREEPLGLRERLPSWLGGRGSER